MIELHIPGEKVLVLREEGKLDPAALLAFLGGHCHSLALALHERTGWPLVAFDNGRGECVHVCVQRPDGQIVDITGAHSPEEMTAAVSGGGTIRPVTERELAHLSDAQGWAHPVPNDVAEWVDTALAQTAAKPLEPMTTQTLHLTRETMSGIEVRVSWDGEPEFVVDVRRADQRDESWRRYGRVRFPKDADGVWRLCFSLEFFTDLAERWLADSFDEARADRELHESTS